MCFLRFESRRLAATTASIVIAASALALAQARPPYEPQVYQPGKDVVWVPTPEALVEKMLDLAKVTSADVVVDLGSGDGRTVIAAAKRGARALGVEYNPDMVALSERNATAAGVADRARFVKADLFQTDLSAATVITMFLLPDLNLRLRPALLQLRPGTRIVSNTFTMGEWTPDDTATLGDACTAWCKALLWVVPARVSGTWHLPDGTLTLAQSFQNLSGTLVSGGTTIPVVDGRLHGNEIGFGAGGAQYAGRVDGQTMEGTMTSNGSSGRWRASR